MKHARVGPIDASPPRGRTGQWPRCWTSIGLQRRSVQAYCQPFAPRHCRPGSQSGRLRRDTRG